MNLAVPTGTVVVSKLSHFCTNLITSPHVFNFVRINLSVNIVCCARMEQSIDSYFVIVMCT